MSEPRDPLAGFESLRRSLPETRPLPAHEVRRRGDRMRRSRQCALALTSAAAVAALALGGNWLASTGTEQPAPVAPTPTNSPSPTPTPAPDAPRVATRIPAAFPLNDGWPANPGGVTEPSPDYQSWFTGRRTPCDTALPTPQPAERLTSIWTGSGESRSRELLTFGSAEQAGAFSDSVRAAYAGCGTTAQPTDLPRARADESWQVAMRLRAGGEQLLQVTRAGHVVFVDTGVDQGSDASAMSAAYVEQSAGVLAAICDELAGACHP